MAMVKDPVCQMDIDADEAESKGLVSEFNKQKRFFCSERCKQQYDLEPEKFGMRLSEFQSPENLTQPPT